MSAKAPKDGGLSSARKSNGGPAPKPPKASSAAPKAAPPLATNSARAGSNVADDPKRPGTPTGDKKAKKKPPAAKSEGPSSARKPAAAALTAAALATGGASTAAASSTPAGGGGGGSAPKASQKVQYLTEEQLSRTPMDAKARDALVAKAGKVMYNGGDGFSYTRDENKRPAGRPDEATPSRHERVPPSRIVLMFNCHISSFELIAGDVSTLPEADVIELRSLSSNASIGRVKIAPEKSTPIEERIEFPNEWRVGSEHGLHHDGLQADGYIEVRMDWKAESRGGGGLGRPSDENRVAILRVNPWLAYGCGEGARVAIRKPGALEGTASTVQRVLRDDSVVVRRDGSVGEVTVDPTPFTVVLGTNPRHPPGTRLLFVHENACVDALVEPWPESEIDIKEGSRHCLSVEGRQVSGWLTKVTKEGAENLRPADDGDESHFLLQTTKALAVRSGCDPTLSEKTGSINPKTPIRVLEVRETEEFGVRAFVSTMPGQAITVTAALNEFNHSTQRFPTVAEYEAARANYCEDIVTREALVEDAITGNMLRIKDQTLHISTATDVADNNRQIPAEWNVNDVRDLVGLLLQASPSRSMGLHPALPVLVRAGPGTGKTWMAKQAVFTLADRLQRGQGSADGIRLVPIVVFVQRIIYLLREGAATTSRQQSLLGRYIESMYSGKKYETWCDMLMQAYEMRALIVLLDGVDEAAGLRDQIEGFVHKELVPSGNRVLVTSRPEGIRLSTYSKTFIVMNLCQLTNEQQRRVINIQMQGNIFFDHLLSLGEVRKALDDAYRRIGALTRGDLETMWSPNRWLADGSNDEFNPDERLKEVGGARLVAITTKAPKSAYIKKIDAAMKLTMDVGIGGKAESLLDRIDAVMKKLPATSIEAEFKEAVLAGFVANDAEAEEHHTAAVLLGVLLQKRKRADQEAEKEKKATKGSKAAKGDADGEKGKADEKAKEEKKKEEKVDKAAAAATDKADKAAKEKERELYSSASKLWLAITQRTDEIYVVQENMKSVFQEAIKKVGNR